MLSLWRKTVEAIVILGSSWGLLICLRLAQEQNDPSWYWHALAILALFVLWVYANHDDEPWRDRWGG
jgi:hypothetical protein